jgi:hypothetical protein
MCTACPTDSISEDATMQMQMKRSRLTAHYCQAVRAMGTPAARSMILIRIGNSTTCMKEMHRYAPAVMAISAEFQLTRQSESDGAGHDYCSASLHCDQRHPVTSNFSSIWARWYNSLHWVAMCFRYQSQHCPWSHRHPCRRRPTHVGLQVCRHIWRVRMG